MPIRPPGCTVAPCAARTGSAAIAAELEISEQTVKKHVSNILDKLHLADRTQAAVYAWQEGLVRRGRRQP
jgi:NarL family two-component system response regulator LiaR